MATVAVAVIPIVARMKTRVGSANPEDARRAFDLSIAVRSQNLYDTSAQEEPRTQVGPACCDAGCRSAPRGRRTREGHYRRVKRLFFGVFDSPPWRRRTGFIFCKVS